MSSVEFFTQHTKHCVIIILLTLYTVFILIYAPHPGALQFIAAKTTVLTVQLWVKNKIFDSLNSTLHVLMLFS